MIAFFLSRSVFSLSLFSCCFSEALCSDPALFNSSRSPASVWGAEGSSPALPASRASSVETNCVCCSSGQAWTAARKGGEAALVLLTQYSQRPAGQDKFTPSYPFFMQIIWNIQQGAPFFCGSLPRDTGPSHFCMDACKQFSLYSLTSQKGRESRPGGCMYFVYRRKKLILSSTKELSPSKLCRKYNFRTYPTVQPLRTEELEEGS